MADGEHLYLPTTSIPMDLTGEGTPGARYAEEFRQFEWFAVVKIGGELVKDSVQLRHTTESLKYLQDQGLGVVAIHGGGPQIKDNLDAAKIESRFDRETGYRLTSAKAAKIVKHSLEEVNTELVYAINMRGGNAEGVVDGVFHAELLDYDRFGMVGTVNSINTSMIRTMYGQWGAIPVVSPIGSLDDAGKSGFKQGSPVNINADVAASELTKSMHPHRFISLTKVGAVLDTTISDPSKQRKKRLTEAEAERMIEAGIISEGMIPKVRQGFELLNARAVDQATIVSPLLVTIELFTDDGAGTILEAAKEDV